MVRGGGKQEYMLGRVYAWRADFKGCYPLKIKKYKTQ